MDIELRRHPAKFADEPPAMTEAWRKAAGAVFEYVVLAVLNGFELECVIEMLWPDCAAANEIEYISVDASALSEIELMEWKALEKALRLPLGVLVKNDN